MNKGLVWASALAVLVLSACVHPRTILPPGPAPDIEVGQASWYGSEFHGRPTSSHEIYNMNDMTAAHPTLPFGSYVMVTNLENNRTAVVRINDRGPFIKNRIIDLSYAAARILEIVGPGTARVRVEVLKGYQGRVFSSGRFSVQVGAFSVQENATILKKRLEGRYGRVSVSLFQTPSQVFYRVRVGAKDRDDALRTARKLSEEGFPVLLIEE